MGATPSRAEPAAPLARLSAGADPAAPADKPAFRRIAAHEAEQAGLPFSLVDAVMKVESDYRPDRIGDVGEVGLMQVLPTTAAMLGFRGTLAELADPATNIHYGAQYLATAWRLAKGNVCRTLMKYRAGHGSETMSLLSVSYCRRAQAHLINTGSPLAAAILPADLIAAVGATPSAPLPAVRPMDSLTVGGKPKTGAAFWSAFQARIRRANAEVEAKWRRMAAR